jgi:glycine oxidase
VILIIGGGVIGLSIGWQLARHQMEVHIYEKGEAGKEAGWAAAGMLAPYSEAGLEDLGQISLNLYPRFLHELQEDANTNLLLENSGTLHVGIDRHDSVCLERLFHNLQRKNVKAEWLTAQEARKREPFLSPRISSAIWIADETHINNKRLLTSLKKAFETRGGILHEYHPVKHLWIEDECLKGIFTDQPIAGKYVINCAGAWAEDVFPNKGQILTLSMQAQMRLTYMIRSPRVYLVPKSDLSLRIGATSEAMGFDQRITAGGILDLLQSAYDIVPEIAYMEFKEAEAKLRPESSDGQPRIGETDLKGFYQAIGHGRAGILLAPYTAYKMVEKLCKSK